MWRVLAGAVAGVHYTYMGYMVSGGFIAWRWPKTIWLHVVAVIWAALIVTVKFPCPLTAAQNNFREKAGERPLSDSFINTYIRGTFYPTDHQGLARLLTGLVIIASWVGFARSQNRRKAARLLHSPAYGETVG
jgi:hypothetical protein